MPNFGNSCLNLLSVRRRKKFGKYKLEITDTRVRELRSTILTFEDRLPDLESLRPEEEGVGVVGISMVKSDGSGATGDGSAAASDLTTDGDGTAEEDEEEISSRVLGTYTHRFNPSDSFAFLHLLPMLTFPLSLQWLN